MNLTCTLVDVCCPEYWGGHRLPHVAVPVSRDTTFVRLRAAIVDELLAGAVGGVDATPETTYENDDWYYAAIRAVMRDVQPRDPSVAHLFHDLDVGDDDEYVEQVYAYFVFAPEE